MTRSRVALVTLPAVTGLLGLSVGLGAIGLLACWFLVALGVPGDTVVRRLVYALVVLFALNAALLTVLALLDRRCFPSLALATYLVVLPVAVLRTAPTRRLSLLDHQDAWALGLAGLTAAILLPPLLHATPGDAMALISQTTDGGNHTQLVLATQHDGGYLAYRPFTGLRPGMQNYPGAWSGNVWMLGHVLLGRELRPLEVVRLLGFLGVGFYALLTMQLARLALALTAAFGFTSRGRYLLTIVLTAMTTTLGFGLFLLNLNSYTQIVALVAITSALLVLREKGTPSEVTFVAMAATVVVAQTWYLLLPVMAAVLLADLTHVRAARGLVGKAIALTGPFVAFPLVTGPGSHQIQSSGPEILPVLVGILGLLTATGAAVVVLLQHRPSRDALRLATAVALVSLLLLVVALIALQPHSDPGASYYTAKVLLILFLVGATAAAAAGSGLSLERPLSAVAVIGLLCSVWATRGAALPPRSAHTQGHLDVSELDAVFNRHPDGLDPGTDVWIADGCDRVWDLVASKWIYDLSLTWTDARVTALNAYADDPHDGVDIISARAKDPTVTSLEVVVHHVCHPAEITELARLPKVTVIRVS